MYRHVISKNIKHITNPTKKIWVDHLKKFIVVKNDSKTIKKMYKMLEKI